uniref:Uncharacterized protein n=1 Tax=Denticeps clupeoides TaxID=299321 RepID=A0AAY4DPR9_9TELE
MSHNLLELINYTYLLFYYFLVFSSVCSLLVALCCILLVCLCVCVCVCVIMYNCLSHPRTQISLMEPDLSLFIHRGKSAGKLLHYYSPRVIFIVTCPCPCCALDPLLSILLNKKLHEGDYVPHPHICSADLLLKKTAICVAVFVCVCQALLSHPPASVVRELRHGTLGPQCLVCILGLPAVVLAWTISRMINNIHIRNES